MPTLTPDTTFPSDNSFGIPSLLLNLQGDYIDLPALPWGAKARRRCRRQNWSVGTFHFYVDDYRFSAVWDKPDNLVEWCPVSVVEPNYTTGLHTTLAEVLWLTYKKRWLARYWQSKGIRVFVDLFVEPRFYEANLLGVPRTWRSFATRYQAFDHIGQPWGFEGLESDYRATVQHTGTTENNFCVVGGSEPTENYCAERGWLWIPDNNYAIRSNAAAAGGHHG